VVGGVVGGVIAVAAPRLRRRQPDDQLRDSGLEAFEGAPCWQYHRGRETDGEEPG
jgi:hypothetical protein